MQPSLFDDPPSPVVKSTGPASAGKPSSPAPALDQAERDFAIDPSHHVVLEASAGTGKTKVLVDRYVRLIELGVDPRNILAITFTRKAAGEMRDRVLKAMRARALESPAMAERWRELKDRIADVNISTIDAFCFGLLREFPLEADVDPAFEIADETEVPRFRAEAIEHTIRACRELVVTDEAVRLLLAYRPVNALRSALERQLDARHVSLPAVREFVRRRGEDTDVRAASEAFVDDVRALFGRTPYRAELFDGGPARSPAFARLRRDLTGVVAGTFDAGQPGDVRRLQKALEFYFTRDRGTPRKQTAREFEKLFDSSAAKSAHNAAIKAIAPDVAGVLEALEIAINGVLAKGFLHVLEESVAQFERLLAERSVLDFPAMLARSVELLGRREEFARSRLKLESRYQHLLVDEFQDTSLLQWQLITLLTESWAQGEGAEETPPSIFIVGDRKQSIYRFRHAEVTLMDEAAAFIGALRPGAPVRRAIQQSFRAVPELLGFVNALSTEMRSDAEIPERFQYRDIDRFPGVEVSNGARRDGQPVLGLAVGATIEATANSVATEIARLLEAETPVRDAAGMRAIRPDDIAILFRSRAGHRYYEEALESRGIKTYVYKGLGFFDAPEVQDLQVLLRYLAQPDANIRAAALLRSRLIRLSDAALVALAPNFSAALADPAFDLSRLALSPIDAQLLTAARAGAATWLAAADRVPPAELIDRILDETAYYFELGGPRLSQARENVKKVRSLIRRVQNRGYATFARLADYFRRLATGEEANAIVAARGCVQLMTVHSAKGLEFPVVFVVRMNAGVGERPAAISVVPKDGDGNPDVAISVGSAAGRIEMVREQEESRRLFYVAMTRARDRLFFSAEIDDDRKFGSRPGFAKLLPAGLKRAMVTALAGGPEVEWITSSNETFAFRVCPPDPNAPAISREAQFATGAVDTAPLESSETLRVQGARGPGGQGSSEPRTFGPSSSLLGSLVHRLFQRKVDPKKAPVVRAAVEQLLRADERAAIELDEVVPQAAEMYAAMRARADVSDLLASGECHYEVPFSLRHLDLDGPSIVRGQIDCVVVPDSGPVSVVEFKTGQRRPEHEAQLALYVQAAAAVWPGRKIEGRLFYLGLEYTF
jgi:ATP-dependent helicase/nuclease subunit A